MVPQEMKHERQDSKLVWQNLDDHSIGVRLPMALVTGRKPDELSDSQPRATDSDSAWKVIVAQKLLVAEIFL